MDNGSVCGKERCEQVTLKPDEGKDKAAEDQTNADSGEHGFFGPFQIACTDILGNEGRHGLHQGAGDQHCKVDNFTGDTIAGGGFQAEAVDKGAEGEERNLGQKFLQGEGKSDA